jgi:hypothetical protein
MPERAPTGLNAELDTAFATVQAAIEQHAAGAASARTAARDCLTRTAALVHAAVADPNRSEAEKRLLTAKMRALIGAASRIPGVVSTK